MRRVLPTLLLLLAVALLAGCGGADEEPAAPQPPPNEIDEPAEPDEPVETPAEQDPTVLRVYLMRDEHVGVGARHVEPTPAVGRAALEELLEGPNELEREAGLDSEIPEGTELLGLTIDDGGHALVDLSREFESGGGSLSMQARVAQVVFTATQFPTVERVTIRLAGDDVEAIGGEGVPARDLTRADFEELTPQILLESPAPGARVASPLRLQGMSNTFEATFQFELLGADGDLLVENFVTASAGSGVWGMFDASFPFDVPEPGVGRLVVFEISAKDASRLHEVEIAVELAP